MNAHRRATVVAAEEAAEEAEAAEAEEMAALAWSLQKWPLKPAPEGAPVWWHSGGQS